LASGFTYKWSDLITVLGKVIKGAPISSISPQMCDFVSNEMYSAYPWYWTITNIASGLIPLSDGVQDYSSPAQIYRLLRGSIERTDTTPKQNRELNVVDYISETLTKLDWTQIRSISMQQSIGLLRLEAAVSVPTGQTLEIRGDYQILPTKITATSQNLWFPDVYAHVALEGLKYWGYQLTDDTRADVQLLKFKSKIQEMKESQDYGTNDAFFPESPLGEGRNTGLSIFGAI
jgi:hypothetical protein